MLHSVWTVLPSLLSASTGAANSSMPSTSPSADDRLEAGDEGLAALADAVEGAHQGVAIDFGPVGGDRGAGEAVAPQSADPGPRQAPAMAARPRLAFDDAEPGQDRRQCAAARSPGGPGAARSPRKPFQ
jgi:hypothetical protein